MSKLNIEEEPIRKTKVSMAPTVASGKPGSGGGGVGSNPPRTQSMAAGQVKSKSIAGASTPSTRSQAQIPKLPTCPEGQTMTSSGVPCERSTQGRHAHKRKPGFRVPLKKEDGNMESQIIEYNCEFPNRVVVRLEYLMQTTKVRLNDRNYMDDFYGKLLEEERIALSKATRHRERLEQNRMKKLIIDGIDKDIPPELHYLHRHPVFRVNQMLSRLQNYDSNLALQPNAFDDEITPVEPYEYNGNQFFQHLHETGELWVPSSQRLFDDEKLEGKIYRAKLRLLQKKKEEAAEEMVLRILNNIQSQQQIMMGEDDMVGGEEGDLMMHPMPSDRPRPSWLDDIEKEKNNEDSENAKLNKALKMQISTTQPFSAADMAVERIKANAQREVSRISEKIRRSKQHELDLEALLEVKRREQEINYVDTFNYEKARVIQNYEKRQRKREVDELFDKQDKQDKEQAVGAKSVKINEPVSSTSGKKKPYKRLFEPPTEEESTYSKGSSKFAKEQLFTKLQRAYGVKSTFPFHHYEGFDNELIQDYLEQAEDGDELIEDGGELINMYTRELMVTDDHIQNWQKELEKVKETLRKR